MSVFKTTDLPNVSIDQSGKIKIKALPASPGGKKRPPRRGKRR